MTNTKLYLTFFALSLTSLSARAIPIEKSVPPYEGEKTESTTITLLNFSTASAWQVLEDGLADYDVMQSSRGGQFAITSCGGVEGNKFYIWGEQPEILDGEYPRTLFHITSECGGSDEASLLKIQDDILNAALAYDRAAKH